MPQPVEAKVNAVGKELTSLVRKRPNESAVLAQWLAAAYLIQENQSSLAFHVSENLLALIHQLNLRCLDAVQARGFFFLSLAAERLGSLPSIRERLMLTYRTCVLSHDISGQATLLNLLLRNYLKNNLYEQADALLSKATFPESEVSNNQHARYLYYSGRVRAVQLNYTESYRLLLAAQRKAPQQRARGFRIAVLKLATVVQLLMGDIPDKSSLTSPDTAVAVSAYGPSFRPPPPPSTPSSFFVSLCTN
jgi:26S proteasome regulatory subunit N3